MNIFDSRSSKSASFCQLCVTTMADLATDAQDKLKAFESGGLGMVPKTDHEKAIYRQALRRRKERGDFGRNNT